MTTMRRAVGTFGSIEGVSLDKNRPGKVIVKLALHREAGMIEALAALSDGQLPVAVTLDSLQAEMEIPEREEKGGYVPEREKVPEREGFSDRLRKDVEEAAQ